MCYMIYDPAFILVEQLVLCKSDYHLYHHLQVINQLRGNQPVSLKAQFRFEVSFHQNIESNKVAAQNLTSGGPLYIVHLYIFCPLSIVHCIFSGNRFQGVILFEIQSIWLFYLSRSLKISVMLMMQCMNWTERNSLALGEFTLFLPYLG